jgi:hypothetical protein
MREIYFDFWKSFVSIVRVCCFDVFIIFSLLDLNEETLLVLVYCILVQIFYQNIGLEILYLPNPNSITSLVASSN